MVAILAYMAKGDAVDLHPIHKELSLYEAADILGVSRSYLVGLLESGEIPYWMEGTTRRILCQDVLDYKKRSDEESMKVLKELADQAQRLNMGY
ncbi:MAG: excisionase family DNA-binding protein [Scytonema sp. PMC 1069.18]|nr:excisionase family DNA-binding protein [Scytonema sp. PMC 1069.18]MEC4881102.1 excisionase family DNA-binding protein [Scytonema sp. PMC 1070.18]